MATLKELSGILMTFNQDQENTDERIRIAFEMLDLYRTLKKSTQSDVVECCRAAVVLSGIVQKGLGSRTNTFLTDYEHKIPLRAAIVLRSAIMRMEAL